MAKQIRTLIGVALLLAAVSAFAQSPRVVRVKVPFPFVTAGKSWPAGDYNVQVRLDVGTVTLITPGIASATMLTTAGSWSPDGRSYLQFERADDRWVLQEVALDGTTHVLPRDEFEKEVAGRERVALEAQSPVEP